MNEEVKIRMKESSWSFLNIVLPIIKKDCKWFQEGKIISIESEIKSWLAKEFDVLGGADLLQIITDKGIRFIANRIQWGLKYKDWKSITLREESHGSKNTEVRKRMIAIYGNEGFFYPWLTSHSYLDKKGPGAMLLSSATIKTKDLFDCYKYHPGIFRRQEVDEKDGSVTRFIFAKVETLEAYVPEIYIYDPESTEDSISAR